MRIALVLSSVLTIAALATPAFADDGKHYPGLECKSNNPSLIYSAGRVLNTSTATNQLLCPVIRDVGGSAGIKSARIFVIDQDPTDGASVDCALYVRSVFTGDVDWSNASSAAGSSPNTQQLTLGSITGVPGLTYDELRCNAPGADAPAVGRSGVVSYSVTEL